MLEKWEKVETGWLLKCWDLQVSDLDLGRILVESIINHIDVKIWNESGKRKIGQANWAISGRWTQPAWHLANNYYIKPGLFSIVAILSVRLRPYPISSIKIRYYQIKF